MLEAVTVLAPLSRLCVQRHRHIRRRWRFLLRML